MAHGMYSDKLWTLEVADYMMSINRFVTDSNPVVLYDIIMITVKSKFVQNEHARYKLKYFSIDNARVIYTKGLNS
jgi:hypothetical protein